MLRRLLTMGVLAFVLLLVSPGVAGAAAPVCTTPTPVSVPFGTTVHVSGPGVCSDDDGDALVFEVVTAPQHGTVAGPIAAGDMQYTSEVGYTGADSFAFRANDGTTDSNTVTVSVAVGPNAPPRCPPSFSLNAEPGRDTFFILNELPHPEIACSDPEHVLPTYEVIAPPVHGTLQVAAWGFTYHPDAGYAGPDSFTFKASDGVNLSNPSTVLIKVLEPNRAPYCVTPLTLRIRPGESVVVDPRVACSDPDGDRLYAKLPPGSFHGDFSMRDGVLTYTPIPGFIGTDVIRYRALDLRGGESNDATMTIVVAESVSAAVADTIAPVVVTQVARRTIAGLRRRGLALVLRSSEACRVTVTLSIARGTARRLGLRSRTIGSATRRVPTGSTRLVVKLTPKARKALRRAAKMRLRVAITATDAAGNRQTRVRNLTVSR